MKVGLLRTSYSNLFIPFSYLFLVCTSYITPYPFLDLHIIPFPFLGLFHHNFCPSSSPTNNSIRSYHQSPKLSVIVRLSLFACLCSLVFVCMSLFACLCSLVFVCLSVFACLCSLVSVRLRSLQRLLGGRRRSTIGREQRLLDSDTHRFDHDHLHHDDGARVGVHHFAMVCGTHRRIIDIVSVALWMSTTGTPLFTTPTAPLPLCR